MMFYINDSTTGFTTKKNKRSLRSLSSMVYLVMQLHGADGRLALPLGKGVFQYDNLRCNEYAISIWYIPRFSFNR